MTVELGIIEGFYGEPWSWRERRESIACLAPYGYRFHIYAPKGDAFLRRAWREPFPAALERELASLIEAARAVGVEVGVGLSPYELHRAFDDDGRRALDARVQVFNRLGVDRLAILFDDMRGDLPRLAEIQAAIVHRGAERSRARRILMCPTYYSDDPVLDRVFGRRPDGYLDQLGRLLDPAIGVYWTGPEICSPAILPEHLAGVEAVLGRPVDLWDNYPVNDGQRMCRFLHLRPFAGRPAENAAHLVSHGINPMTQAVLSRIPALTLAASYGSAPMTFRGAATEAVGPVLAERLERDVAAFQDRGLDALSPAEISDLRRRYAAIEGAGAREIVAWLDGKTVVTRDQVLTQ